MSNKKRNPIVVILGHVDHGKTTLIDAIRNTSIQLNEPSGITQNIYLSTYKWRDNEITFVDTPGHEVFSLMRSNGGKVADLALIVIAADESLRPQTIESFEIVNKNNLKYIVVITKIDKPGANAEKIRSDLVKKGIYLEGYGGNIPYVEVSAVNKEGITELLDLINLICEVENVLDPEITDLVLFDKFGDIYKRIETYGVILDSSVDKFLGKMAFGVLKKGEINRRDRILIGTNTEVVGPIFDYNKKAISKVKTGEPFILSGLSELPVAGTDLIKTDDLNTLQYNLRQNQPVCPTREVKDVDAFLDDLFDQKAIDQKLFILKTDVDASFQAIGPELEAFSSEDLSVKLLCGGVGNITESDIENAKTFNAVILGFRVRIDRKTQDVAKKQQVTYALFDTVYKLYDYIKEVIDRAKSGECPEVVLGELTVKKVFELSDKTLVAGGVVTAGEIKKGQTYKITRNGEDVVGATGKIISIKVIKEERPKVGKGTECGINLGENVEVEEGDIVKVF